MRAPWKSHSSEKTALLPINKDSSNPTSTLTLTRYITKLDLLLYSVVVTDEAHLLVSSGHYEMKLHFHESRTGLAVLATCSPIPCGCYLRPCAIMLPNCPITSQTVVSLGFLSFPFKTIASNSAASGENLLWAWRKCQVQNDCSSSKPRWDLSLSSHISGESGSLIIPSNQRHSNQHF